MIETCFCLCDSSMTVLLLINMNFECILLLYMLFRFHTTRIIGIIKIL